MYIAPLFLFSSEISEYTLYSISEPLNSQEILDLKLMDMLPTSYYIRMSYISIDLFTNSSQTEDGVYKCYTILFMTN